MSGIASKNVYELLGNDPELDPDREPEPPTKIADRPAARSGKRNNAVNESAGNAVPAQGAEERARGGGGHRGKRGSQVVPINDRSQPTDDNVRRDVHVNRTRGPREHRGGGERGQGRGGRGFSDRYTRAARSDRPSHSGITDTDKQVAQGWGGQDGNAEWQDEKAGEAIAQAEAVDDSGFTPDVGAGDPAFSNGPGAPGEVIEEEPEPEDKTKSYDEYMAELQEKRAALGDGGLKARKANEGSKQKFPEGSAFTRNQDEENFIAGSAGKARREREKQVKNTVNLDGQYYAAPESNDRGGRGGRGRGGRGRGEGRGEFRGDRGDRGGRGGGRGRGEGRGEFRGGRGGGRGGDRGAPRGGGNFNANDQSAFPALGGS